MCVCTCLCIQLFVSVSTCSYIQYSVISGRMIHSAILVCMLITIHPSFIDCLVYVA